MAEAIPALKEWAVIVRALLAGEQILDLRKGGLHETDRHFSIESPRFWLYPTVEHQEAELLEAAYRRWIAESEATAPPQGSIRIEGWAEVVTSTTITTDEELDALASKVIWTGEYAAKRMRWKRHDPLWVLALRVWRLAEPVVVPWREAYGGCTSWVPIDGMPDDPTTLPAEPALSDTSFEARLNLVRDALPSLG